MKTSDKHCQLNKGDKIMNKIVDFTSLLEKAKELNDKLQKAKHHICDVTIAHKSEKLCDTAYKTFCKLEKEFKKWKKDNIEKYGLILKTVGDKDEPIAIAIVLAGNWNAPMKLINGQWVVDKR
jgi:hypothetical protein